MDTSISLRINGNPQQWGGNSSSQSSNLNAAKHFAQELQSRGGQLQSLSIEGHSLQH